MPGTGEKTLNATHMIDLMNRVRFEPLQIHLSDAYRNITEVIG